MVDAPRFRRTSEQVTADEADKLDRKEAVEATKANSKKKVAELEAMLRDQQQNAKENAAHPMTIQVAVAVREPEPKKTVARSVALKASRDKKAASEKEAKLRRAEKTAATKATKAAAAAAKEIATAEQQYMADRLVRERRAEKITMTKANKATVLAVKESTAVEQEHQLVMYASETEDEIEEEPEAIHIYEGKKKQLVMSRH